MLSLHSAALRTPTTDAFHASGTSGGAAPLGTDPAGFASLLRQSQVPTPPLPVAPPPTAAAPSPQAVPQHDGDGATPTRAPAEHDGADADTQASPSTSPGGRARTPAKAPARALDDTAHTRRTADTPAGDHAATPANPATAADPATATAATPATPAHAHEPAADPNLMQWLAGQQRAAAARSDAGSAATDGTTAPGDAGRVPATTRNADLKADAVAKDAVAPGRTAHDAATAGAIPFATALDEKRPTEPVPALPGRALDAIQSAGATSAAASAPLAATPDAAAPVAVALATPVNSPDFPQALGLQMSMLARDGVQRAELRLNPAEMGPVSVQITMDGTQAHVAFGADAAATRHAIEAGLPQLASALQDAGFTLAGGGVSQHSRGGRPPGGGDATPERGERRAQPVGDAGLARVGTAARRIVTAGGIDLFA